MKNGLDPEPVYGYKLWIRTDDFPKLTGTFLSKDIISDKVFMKILSFSPEIKPNRGKCPISQW